MLLLLLATSVSCRSESSQQPTRSAATVPPGFRDVSDERGLVFAHDAGPTEGFFFPQIMGPGCALLDCDGDGDLDVYLINGGDHSAPVSATSVNRLFRQAADGQFVDVTSASGLGDPGYGMGVAVGDVNNDSHPDVYVTNYGPDRLYLNRGDGTFEDISEGAIEPHGRWSASACFFDYDRDGWLDLFVTNYVDYTPRRCIAASGGGEDYCAPYVFPPLSDRLLRNETGDTDGGQRQVRFRDVSVEAGIAQAAGPGLGVVAGDFNGDDWPDVYVANDQSANFLWINQQDGTFRDEAALRGCANDTQGRAQAGMGIALGDFNNDSFFDLAVTHLEGEAHALYVGDELGFREASAQTGLAGFSFPVTGFGAAFVDLNTDGFLDLVVANGRVRRSTDLPGQPVQEHWFAYAERNQVFMNNGRHGWHELTRRQFPLLSVSEVSRGLALGDINNDGIPDVLVSNTGGRARLYISEGAEGNWLTIRAVAPPWGGRDAYGAIVDVKAGNRAWRRLVNPAGSYLSSSDPRVYFGLGDVAQVDSIDIKWPDGKVERFAGGPVNRVMVLAYGQGTD